MKSCREKKNYQRDKEQLGIIGYELVKKHQDLCELLSFLFLAVKKNPIDAVTLTGDLQEYQTNGADKKTL